MALYCFSPFVFSTCVEGRRRKRRDRPSFYAYEKLFPTREGGEERGGGKGEGGRRARTPEVPGSCTLPSLLQRGRKGGREFVFPVFLFPEEERRRRGETR